MPEDLSPTQKRAPTFYAIIALKLAKGLLLLSAAIVLYVLSDNDLPVEFKSLLHHLGQDPQRKFFVALAKQISTITEVKMLWAAAGTFIYCLFSLVEGVGLIFRVSWAGWLVVAEGAFFIPIEIFELLEKGFSWAVFIIMVINVIMVVYLVRNRHRLFRHHFHLEEALLEKTKLVQ
jgi:uncharacterized membrane protein (DUF2068 family)